MPVVDLNRRFHEWTEEDPPDPEMRRSWGLDDDGIGWDELLLKRRVVILAEAGSGKSTEFRERARLLGQKEAFVFHASVEDVGREGLENAITATDRQKLSAWRTSAEKAWFFIDSVDEAKAGGIRLDKVLRKLSDAIQGAEARAHIILSSRTTDWELRRDLASLTRWLPVSSIAPKPAPTAREELLQLLDRLERRNDEEQPAPDAPFVAIMAPLDRERIRRFAEGKSTPNVERFLLAIEEGDLWHFARRPLDLDWLARFWQGSGRLGSLQEMVERSIEERLKESNLDRARSDEVQGEDARRAVERIGAAMVFGRRGTIAIPDGEPGFGLSDSSLDLSEVLPDWSAEARMLLLTRALFDPATLGRVRFHNDNDGVVRGFLTARWLLRLREAGLPTQTLLDLLFAESYGLEVIKPSLNETAAWLSLWDRNVANEVTRRGPGLLLIAGDPASLPPDVRRAALVSLLQEGTRPDQEWPWWDNDGLRRFAQLDLGDTVKSMWEAYQGHREASQFLVRLVWLGRMKDCCGLALQAARDGLRDHTGRILAGRALLATADQAVKRDYAVFILAERLRLPPRMVGEAISELFPTFISLDAVLEMLGEADLTDDHHGLGFESEGSQIVEKLRTPGELEKLLTGLLALLDGTLHEGVHNPPTAREKVLFPAIASATQRLLQLTPPDDAPGAAVDALLHLCNRVELGTEVRQTAASALAELQRTAARRRFAFWRVVATLRVAFPKHEIDRPGKIEFFGYKTGLQVEDVDWLLADGMASSEEDRRLAVSAAVAIYRTFGEPDELLGGIASRVQDDPAALSTYRELTEPRPASEWQLEMERESEERKRLNEAQRTGQVQLWMDFIQALQTDPDRLAKLKSSVSPNDNADLFNLWRLLSCARSRSQYAIEDVDALVRVAGTDVAQAARLGLIACWRLSRPQIRSRRAPDAQNFVRDVDLMGLSGITLEAAGDHQWATRLNSDEATRAAEYATLELNGYPRWLPDLIEVWPDEVRSALVQEIRDEFSRKDAEGDSLQNLRNVAYSQALSQLVAPSLLDDLELRAATIPPSAVFRVLWIIAKGLAESDRPRFVRLGIDWFKAQADTDSAVWYLATVLAMEPQTSANELAVRCSSLTGAAQTSILDRFFTLCFGDRDSFRPADVSPAVLEQLLGLHFGTYSQVAARRRPSGVIYSPTAVDDADRARNAVLTKFVETPGAATYHALRRFQSTPGFPMSAARLRALAERRAVEDSECAPWPPSEALAFEKTHEAAPQNARDLRTLLLRRIEDMQHDLLHGDFGHGRVLKTQPLERDVQNWIADRLRSKQGRAYSVEREPHVADEKEPDIRIRAKATDASVAVEIKIAESWSLKELDDALEAQLCGRYLRAEDGRYGVLLLVHQDKNKKPKGWQDKSSNTFLSFQQVSARLKSRAVAISGKSHDSPQPDVAVLDVSGC